MWHVNSLDSIHQLSHEEQAAPVFAIEIVRRGRIGVRLIEVKTGALIANFHDESSCIDFGADVNVFGRIVSVAAQDGIRQCFAERDGHVEHDLPLGEIHDLALATDQLDDVLDEPDIARNVELDDPDVVAKGVPIQGSGHS